MYMESLCIDNEFYLVFVGVVSTLYIIIKYRHYTLACDMTRIYEINDMLVLINCDKRVPV